MELTRLVDRILSLDIRAGRSTLDRILPKVSLISYVVHKASE